MESTPPRSVASPDMLQRISLAPSSSLQCTRDTTPADDPADSPLNQVSSAALLANPAAPSSTCRRLLLSNATAIMNSEPELVHVPGVTLNAYISRQVLLAEIVSSLGLSVHSRGFVNESASSIRAWIEIDIPPGKNQLVVERKTFYSDLAETTHSAFESAAQTVITHLVKETEIQINDASYDQLTSLKRAFEAATSFQNIYRDDERIKLAYITSLKESTKSILRRLQQICIQHAGFLPLEISTSPELAGAEQHYTVHYIGPQPPTTPCESLAMQLSHLASVHTVAGLIMED